MPRSLVALAVSACLTLAACSQSTSPATPDHTPAAATSTTTAAAPAASYASQHLGDYAEVTLSADLSALDPQQKQLLAELIAAADAMNPLFWQQSYGDRAALMARIRDADTRRLAEINYGPWDRLNGDQPFVPGIGAKPLGAGFYPADMSKAEFEAAPLADKSALYTLLRRDANGKLITVPYHVAFKATLEQAAGHLRAAAKLARDPGFAHYLALRADALLADDFRTSDFAWMDMKTNPIDIVIGPIETYEDQLYGYKAAYESYVLVKDQAWSQRLERFARFLPELQRNLPVA
ncbi:MAG TPA: Zn-dependent hydrolase, partial [Rhodanobacteraceae bacterium]|nr:Zn-dependent hydrolase [Rhodanobacteraceae bacterium]